jgi:hypothetical protein
VDFKLTIQYQGLIMKKNIVWISTAMLLAGCQQPADSDSDISEVTLQVLNPRGEIVLPPVTPPSRRIPDLNAIQAPLTLVISLQKRSQRR